jgi:ABC-type lipoprotein export system ATPase subunit
VYGDLVMDLLTAAREQDTRVSVTHAAGVAAYADCEIVVRDGTVGTLTRAKP